MRSEKQGHPGAGNAGAAGRHKRGMAFLSVPMVCQLTYFVNGKQTSAPRFFNCEVGACLH
jgi:hypothetical protein